MVDFIRSDIADQRDQIVFGENCIAQKYFGGLRYFDTLTLNQIDQFDELGVLDMDERQNDSPTIGEMIDFLRARETDGWYVHGYCISPERDDFRITFEGVGKNSAPSRKDIIDFITLFRWADEFYVDDDGLRCWYD